MLVCEWTVFLLLTCGMWWSKYYTHLIAEQQPPKWILQTKAESRSCWKLQQDRNPNPVTVSQVWKEDKPSQRSCGKLPQGNVCDSSGSCGKLQQAIEIQLKRPGWNTIIYKSQIMSTLRKSSILLHKLSRSEKDEVFDLITDVSFCGLYIDSDEFCSSCWPRISTKRDRVQAHELRGAQDVVRYHFETDRVKFVRNSDSIFHDIWFLSLVEVDSCVMTKSPSWRKRKCMSAQV